MSAQVIFFPLTFTPDMETQNKLIFIQEQLTLYHAELAFKMKNLSRGEAYLFKERSHNNVRDTWKIYQGFKEHSKEG